MPQIRFKAFGLRLMAEKIDHSEDSAKTAKTAALSSIANALSVLMGIVSVPLIARVMSQADLGIASTFLANRNIIIIIITLAISSYINKALIELPDDKPGSLYTICSFCIAAIALLFVLTLPFKSAIQNLLSLDNFLFYWLSFSLLSYVLYDIGTHFCIFQNYTKTVFAITLLNGVGGPFLSVLFAWLLPSSKYIGRVLGLDFPFFCVGAVLLIWLFFGVKNKRFNLLLLKQALRFSTPLIPHLLSQMVLTQCDLIMITVFIGAADSGLYSMGHTIGFLAFTAMSQIMAAWSPWVYRRLKADEQWSVKANCSYVISISIILSTGLMAIAPEVVTLLLPASYSSINSIIPPLVMAMYFQTCYLLFFDILYFNRATVRIAIASLCASALNLILNFIFIPSYGFLAACYTTLFSYFSLFFICLLFTLRYKVSAIYDLSFLTKSIVIMLVFMTISLVFCDNIVIRYSAFGIVLLALIKRSAPILKPLIDKFLGQIHR